MHAFRCPPWRTRLRRAAHQLALLLALAACSGHDDAPPPPPPPSVGSATVGPAGGTVSGPDGVSLSVAADPDAADTTLRIARDSTGSPTLAGMTLLSPIYAVTPHGTGFKTSAQLRLPYDAAKAPAGATVVVLRGETDGTWHVSPVRRTVAGAALVDVAGLSWYAIGVCTPGDAGVFGFGIGDCPANHELKLEYLDGNGIAWPVPRDINGFALPFLPDITVPTDVVLRVTWARPAGVDRVDSVRVSGSAVGTLLLRDVNQPTFTQDIVAHLDPTRTAGATAAGGAVRRLLASAYYCWHGFIIGRGDNQTVCWSFDTDLAFRLHDTGPPPALPVITQAPTDIGVSTGESAVFSLQATAADSLVVEWQRQDAAQQWQPAGSTALFPSGGTAALASGNATFTLTAIRPRDDGAQFRARVCSQRASGNLNCLPETAPVTLDVTASRVGPTWVLQPADTTAEAGTTASFTVTASAQPAPVIRIVATAPSGAASSVSCPYSHLSPGSTSCTLTTDRLSLADSGTHVRAEAWNDPPRATLNTSATATLTVHGSLVAPAIVTQPVAASAFAGGSASFKVTATGTAPLSYQWRRDGVALSDAGATASTGQIAGSGSDTLTLSQLQPADAGVYTVVVSNGATPAATSAGATLTVVPLAAVTVPLATGTAHTCAIRADRTVACWGRNATGQLGDGTLADKALPTAVPGLTGAAALAAGHQHTCAALADGRVACWGDVNGLLPAVVPGLTGVVAISAGHFHTCAVRSDGSVACWGANDGGQLGDGTTVARPSPITVPGLAGAVAVAAGRDFTCAARADGSAACWGRNLYGQLGSGNTVDSTSPVAVVGLADVTALAASQNYGHGCALKADHTLACWGLNSWGQLGDGSQSNHTSPNPVPGLTGVVGVATGTVHTCATRNDGSVACWGSDLNHQLGDGGSSSRTSPFTVPGLAGVAGVAAGDAHTCATKSDKTVWCWGSNSNGQLGDGTTVDRLAPTPVTF